MNTAITAQDRTADPGFHRGMNLTADAIAELRRLGVPSGDAAALVQRVYSAGRDRGLYLGVRLADVPAAQN